VAALFYYDGLGRRELSNATPPGAVQNFEYEGSSMIGWNTGGSSPSYNFLTIPGGGALAGSFTSGGTTTTWVPVVDASGSTLGLVNAASPQSGMATTYTYDPSGTPSASGTANEWPFQYKGKEKEFTDPAPYYYSGSGQFYSPQFVRSLTEAGQTSAEGPGGPPPSQVPYGPGSQGNGSFGHWLAKDEEGNLVYLAGSGSTATISIDEVPYALPIVAAIRIVEEWVSFFKWLLGGGGAPPTPRQLLHGRHPLYDWILGIQPGLLPPAISILLDDSLQEPSGEPSGSNSVPAGYVIPIADLKGNQDPQFWKNGPFIEPWMLRKWSLLRGGRKVIPIRPPAPLPESGTLLVDPFPWFFLPGAYCQSLENMHIFDPACGSGGL
jgi:hypothetical protein